MTDRPHEILLVEDNPGDIKLTRMAFDRAKGEYALRVVVDGEAALDYLHKRGPYADATTPSLVLLDINLPKRSGHEVLHAIRSDPDLRRLPVVFLTGSRARADIQRAYDHHVNTYFTKPDNLAELEELVGALDQYWFALARRPDAPPREAVPGS